MIRLGQIRSFFKDDPLGQKIVEQLQDLLSVAKEVRQRLRKRLGEYLRSLQDEE